MYARVGRCIVSVQEAAQLDDMLNFGPFSSVTGNAADSIFAWIICVSGCGRVPAL